MTGSGSAICAYYQYSKDCKLAKIQFKSLKENLKIIGAMYQKLYKFWFFVLYENNIGA